MFVCRTFNKSEVCGARVIGDVVHSDWAGWRRVGGYYRARVCETPVSSDRDGGVRERERAPAPAALLSCFRLVCRVV